MHHVVGIAALDEGAEFFLKLRGCFEAAVGIQVVPEESVDRAWNVATDRIKRFVLATKAVWRAGVDEQHGRAVQVAVNVIGIDPHAGPGFGHERCRDWFAAIGGKRMSAR